MSDTTWHRDEFTGALTRTRRGVRARIVPVRGTSVFRIVLDGRSVVRGQSLLLSARLWIREELALSWADRLLEILEPVDDVVGSSPAAEVSP